MRNESLVHDAVVSPKPDRRRVRLAFVTLMLASPAISWSLAPGGTPGTICDVCPASSASLAFDLDPGHVGVVVSQSRFGGVCRWEEVGTSLHCAPSDGKGCSYSVTWAALPPSGSPTGFVTTLQSDCGSSTESTTEFVGGEATMQLSCEDCQTPAVPPL